MIDLDPDSRSSRGSGARGFFERLFENVDNPLGWSIRLGVVAGITVRIHLFTVVYILGTLVTPILSSAAGFGYVAALMGSLFLVVLLHEFGHCVACRAVGGVADRIVLLPFGGLALCRPPHDWKSDLATTVGGPAVNVALLPITSAALILLGMHDTVIFDPFSPYQALGAIEAGSTAAFYAKATVWSFHYVNLVILAFNVLIPFFPLDGGRIVQALVWSRTSYRRSMEIAILVGFAGAGLLAVIALVFNEMILLLIAIFGAIACFSERQRLTADAELAELNLGPGASGLGASLPSAFDESPTAGPSKRELKQAERDREEAEELDRLLAKISGSGMDSLSGKERKTLDRLSKKKRDG